MSNTSASYTCLTHGYVNPCPVCTSSATIPVVPAAPPAPALEDSVNERRECNCPARFCDPGTKHREYCPLDSLPGEWWVYSERGRCIALREREPHNVDFGWTETHVAAPPAPAADVAKLVRKLRDVGLVMSGPARRSIADTLTALVSERDALRAALRTIADGMTADFPGAPDIMAVSPDDFRAGMWTWSQKCARAALEPRHD